MKLHCLSGIVTLLVMGTLAGAAPSPWPGEATTWKGFQRHNFEVDGRPCRVVLPKDPAPGRPWVWRARFPDFHTGPDRILLERGFHVAYINTDGMLGSQRALEHWDAFYTTMTGTYGLAARPALEAVSRGGLFAYRWAAWYPNRVACIYADTPVCDFKSWPLGQGAGLGHPPTWQNLLKEYEMTRDEALLYQGNPVDMLKPLAAVSLPLLTIVSLSDRVVPPDENTFVLAERYRAMDGPIDIIEVAEGTASSNGHHFTHPDPLRAADFIEGHASALPGREDYFELRGSLDNCRQTFTRSAKGRVVFLGGSITWNSGWRDQTCAYLKQRFPETEFEFINAGIPSTGSVPGAFRLLKDVFSQGGVDLLFEEAAVNDSTNRIMPEGPSRGMEGLLRHARKKNPMLDIVVMHFVDPGKMERYRKGQVPEVIQRHEAAAAQLEIPTLHLAREVTERIDAGQFTWKKDFKNLHPSPYGQRLYAASIRRLLQTAWATPLSPEATRTAHVLPQPLDPFCYDGGHLVSVTTAMDREGFEMVESCDPRPVAGGGVRQGFYEVPMLVGREVGAEFTFPFTGRAAGLFVVAGPDAGQIDWRIDEGAWQRRELFTQWSGGLHLPWAVILADELPAGKHRLHVRMAETQHPKSKGHACRIVHFLVNE